MQKSQIIKFEEEIQKLKEKVGKIFNPVYKH